jgi:hypothetical protein
MKKIIIHIGRHKSGTSSIQRFLKNNHIALKDVGIFYPISNIGTKLAHHEFAKYFENIRHRGKSLTESIEGLRLEISQFKSFLSDKHINIISSEAFQNCNPELLALAFSDYDVEICFYIRNELEYLATAYAQKVHATDYPFSIDVFSDAFNVNYQKFVSKWEASFKVVNFGVFDRSQLINEDVVEDFIINFLMIDNAATVSSFDISSLDQNPSLSCCLIEAKLKLNNKYNLTDKGMYKYLGELTQKEEFKGKYQLPHRIINKVRGSDWISSIKWQKEKFGKVVFNYDDYPNSELKYTKSDIEKVVNKLVERFSLTIKKDEVNFIITNAENLINAGFYSSARDIIVEGINLYGKESRLIIFSNKNRLIIDNFELAFSTSKIDFNDTNSNYENISYIDHAAYIIETIIDPQVFLKRPENGAEHYIYKNNIRNRKPRDIIKIENGYISLDFTYKSKYSFYFFDENKNYIESISSGSLPFLLKNDNIEYEKSLGFIEDRFTKFNICHLICDKIPRYYELDNYHDNIDKYILFSDNDYVNKLKKLLNISTLDITKMNGNKVTIHFKKLYLSSSSNYSHTHPAQLGYAYFHKTIEEIKNKVTIDVEVNTHKKIFIDRSLGKTRNVINQNELNEVLKQHDFTLIKLEELSFDEQVRLFSNAEFVVGVHGAGLTNISFCKAGTKVIEILPPLCATSSFWIPAVSSDLTYNSFIAEDEEGLVADYKNWKHEPKLHNRRNVIVDCKKFDKLLRSM